MMDNHEGTQIANPLITIPAARRTLLRLRTLADETGLPETTRLLVEIRASQINQCAVCLDMHTRELRATAEPSPRIDTIAAWRETPYYTDAERAALALTEAITRLPERPAPEEVRAEAARHFPEPQLAALIIAIATINAFNRIMATTGQITGDWVEHITEQDRTKTES